MMNSKFAADFTANGLVLLNTDELDAVHGGLLTGGEVPVYPTPAPQGSGAMGMKDNWVASRTNDRKSN